MKQNTANIKLSIAGAAVELRVTVPDKPVKQDVVLPLLRDLDQKVEDIAVAKVRASGDEISCSKGCGACCCQLVPLSQLEARYLTAMIEKLPKKNREKLQARFRDVYQKIDAAGILDELMNTENIQDNIVDFGLKYFHLGIPCPFLENDSCSIYRERPLRCREYLVTSPPINCRTPSKESIRLVPFPVRASEALTTLNKPGIGANQQWVPLSLMIAWVKHHPERAVMRQSKEWIEDVLRVLC